MGRRLSVTTLAEPLPPEQNRTEQNRTEQNRTERLNQLSGGRGAKDTRISSTTSDSMHLLSHQHTQPPASSGALFQAGFPTFSQPSTCLLLFSRAVVSTPAAARQLPPQPEAVSSMSAARKRPHSDEVVIFDDDDDDVIETIHIAPTTAEPASAIAPLLSRISDSAHPTTPAAPTLKRVRPDDTTETPPAASPKSTTPSKPTSLAVAPVSPRTPSSARTRMPSVPSPSPPPVVSSHAFTGLYQPHRFIADDTDENKYVIAASYMLSVTLKWNESQTTAALQGRISWRYGLIWLNLDALIDDRQTLFWDVARQSETVTGQAQRVHERMKGGRADDRLRLVMTTRELLPIDASISQFHDEQGDEDETANQVQYTLQQFERQRRYMLEVEDDTRLTGTITMQLQPSFGDRKEAAEEDEEEGRETRVVGWVCDESEVDTNDELQPVQRMHRSFVARMLDILTTQQLKVDVVSKLRDMLDRVLKEPEVEAGKYRRVNSTTIAHKFGESVVDVLRLCGFVDEEVEHRGQRYIVLPDDADLLLVATMRRALPL